MHDPLVVAFEIPRPWPQRSPVPDPGDAPRWKIRYGNGHHPWWRPSSYRRFWRLAGRDFYWPPLITVWHREPGGRDALTVCQKRIQRTDGTWKFTRGWVWHVHHWKIQAPPLQRLRRFLLTRCAWCGGRSREGDAVNVAHQWDGPRGHWWQGEPGLYHGDCSAISSAHQTCICDRPVLEHDSYGCCARCGRRRAFGMSDEHLECARELNRVPAGARRGDDGAARQSSST